jgi:hypothetical protein
MDGRPEGFDIAVAQVVADHENEIGQTLGRSIIRHGGRRDQRTGQRENDRRARGCPATMPVARDFKATEAASGRVQMLERGIAGKTTSAHVP